VTPHAHFRREGDDLHLDLPLTIGEAYHGARIPVPTVDGSVTLKVPERTQSGGKLRLRGKGVSKKGRPAGDLYVHFLVQIPTDASPEVGKLVDELAKHQPDDPRAEIHL
jgi:curved DNA-binding protein